MNRALRRAVIIAQESGLFSGVKPFLKSVLLEGTLPLSSVISNRSFASFTDEKGNEFKLIEGLRDAVKPGWQWVLSPDKNELPDKKRARARNLAAADSVKKTLSFLECFNFRMEGRTVLEIGCGDGARSFALAAEGAGSVAGSDIADYYVRGGDEALDATQKKLSYLKELRQAISETACRCHTADGQNGSFEHKVTFVEDDVTESALPSSEFDLVCSWEVLEHVQQPAKFFAQVERLLKPGGMVFHEYNPFFSINGGHSHCTLDFLWGHVLLGSQDFEKYLVRFRPAEAGQALKFYHESLNRMTTEDIERHSAAAGLQTLAIIPWTERAHSELLTASAFRIAKEIYPDLTIRDLLAPFVWVVQTKP